MKAAVDHPSSTRQLTYRDALREALRAEMLADPRVIVLGEDVGRYGGAYAVTKGLIDEFGETRVIDTPISEALIAGLAVGAAITGARPVAEIMYVDFLTLALDQLANQAAKYHSMFGNRRSVPMVLRTQGGHGRGAGAQHSQSLEAWLAHCPGLKVAAPATPNDARAMLVAAIRDPNPVVFIEHKRLYGRKGGVTDPPESVALGSARVARPGRDVTIITYSNMLYTVMEAADVLQLEDGVVAEVVDLRSLAPVDWPAVLASVERTHRAVVVHEACLTGGLGGEVSARITESLFETLRAPVLRVATPDVIIPANLRLETALIPGVPDVVAAVRRVVDGRSPGRRAGRPVTVPSPEAAVDGPPALTPS
jgi:pyruvate/2-oxoglutarate/acetoin dehydrogenase E1 component